VSSFDAGTKPFDNLSAVFHGAEQDQKGTIEFEVCFHE
jgi:hypothetical protein